MAALKGEVTGENSIAVTGIPTGENSFGVLGTSDAVGVRGDGKGWHGVAGFSKSTIGCHSMSSLKNGQIPVNEEML